MKNTEEDYMHGASTPTFKKSSLIVWCRSVNVMTLVSNVYLYGSVLYFRSKSVTQRKANNVRPNGSIWCSLSERL